MIDAFHVAHEVENTAGVADVAGPYVNIGHSLCRKAVEPTPGSGGRVLGHCANAVTTPNECFDEVRADETVRSCDCN